MHEWTGEQETAILAKEGLTISNIKRLPSGRGIAAMYNRTWIININASSENEKKNKRERFYNDLAHLLLPLTLKLS